MDHVIRDAIMAGNMKYTLPFLMHNRERIQHVENLEHKLRRRDIKVSDSEIFSFYSERLKRVFDPKSLKKLILEIESDSFLRMTIEDLVNYVPSAERLSEFPDTLFLDERSFPLTYRFNPGEDDDGITLHVPYSFAPVIPEEK